MDPVLGCVAMRSQHIAQDTPSVLTASEGPLESPTMPRTARLWFDDTEECRYEAMFSSYQGLVATLSRFSSVGIIVVVLLHKTKRLLSPASMPLGTGPVDLYLQPAPGDLAALCLELEDAAMLTQRQSHGHVSLHGI